MQNVSGAPAPGKGKSSSLNPYPGPTDIVVPGKTQTLPGFVLACAEALRQYGDAYWFGGQVCLPRTIHGEFTLAAATESQLSAAIQTQRRFCRPNNDMTGVQFCQPAPRDLRAILESTEAANACRHVARFAPHHMPYWDVDGSLRISATGYNAVPRLFIAPGAVAVVEMSTQQAQDHLGELVADFEFESLGMLSNYLAFALTPFCRAMYDGPTPMFLVRATTHRAGKDTAVEQLQITFYGRTYSVSLAEDDELEKRFLAILESGATAIHLPNLVGVLRSSLLERVITDPKPTFRRLGTNTVRTFDSAPLLSCSGNSDLTLLGDLPSRAVTVMLTVSNPDPNSRVFRRQNIARWAAQNAPSTLGMLWRFVRDWYESGMPPAAGAFSSFAGWWSTAAAVAQHALGQPLDISTASLQQDPRVLSFSALGDILWGGGREALPASLQLPAVDADSFYLSDLWDAAAALQPILPDLFERTPLSLAHPRALANRAALARWITARVGMQTGRWTVQIINSPTHSWRRRFQASPTHS